jgi:glycosyltransferase involved in cell wall biosynthesis
LRVLQVLGFPPDRLGGTEVYLTELARELSALGIDSTFVAPYGEADIPIREHAGFAVESYPVNAAPTREELRAGAPHARFEAFRQILAGHPSAIYHQHSWTRGCGGHHLRAAKEAGLPTVLTMHVAGNLCMRGDMMRLGQAACDGRIDAQICAACWTQGKGLPSAVAQTLSRLPPAVSRAALNTPGRIGAALASRALAGEKRGAAVRMIEDCDEIVAVCGWARDALIANGASTEKVSLCRQGVSQDFLAAAADLPPRPRGERLELLYLGSWNPLKGVDVVVRAIGSLPAETPLRLTIRAPAGGAEEQAYERRVRQSAGEDARIVFAGRADRASLPGAMAGFDALVVPSITMETGPLVALEAQAAGLFVIGSRLGGIGEIVSEQDAGMLVEPGRVDAWAEALAQLAEAWRGEGLPRPRRPVRGMAAVALEMADIYRRLAA